jgi:ATP-dependent Clp protease ATP-binding subunit ClpA
MARVIQEYIKKPLAELVLFGVLSQAGGVVRVTLNEDGSALVLDASTNESKAGMALAD